MYKANRRQTLRLTAPQDAGYAGEKISKRPVNSARYLRFASDWVCILRTTSYTEPTTRDGMLRYGRICSSYRRNHGVVLRTCDDSCTRRLCQVGDSRRCYGVAIVFQVGFADTGSDPGTPVLEALSSCGTLAKWALVCRDKIQSAWAVAFAVLGTTGKSDQT